MNAFLRTLVFGFLIWLIPFLVAFVIFPLRESARPLFESIMPVAVAVATAGFAVLYFRDVSASYVKTGLAIGFAWWLISLLIDAPLMLLGGPMQMTFGDYFADIGLTYMMMPVITTAIGAALAFQQRSSSFSDSSHES